MKKIEQSTLKEIRSLLESRFFPRRISKILKEKGVTVSPQTIYNYKKAWKIDGISRDFATK